jgi:hypothetical protein
VTSLGATSVDNCMRWTRNAGFSEAWYYAINHRATQSGFWIRYAVCAPQGKAPPFAQLWFAYYDGRDPTRNVAIHKRFDIDQLAHCCDPFWVRVSTAEASATALHGVLCQAESCAPEESEGSDDRQAEVPSISWDLTFQPCGFSHASLPKQLLDRDPDFTRVVAPNVQAYFSGRIQVGTRVFDLDEDPGSQGHLWGRRLPHSWAWAHCGTFREDGTAILELYSWRPRIGPAALHPIPVISLYLGNEVYHFNSLWSLIRAKTRWQTGKLRFSATSKTVRLVGELSCSPADLIRAALPDPSGGNLFCHHTEVANCTVSVFQRRSPRSRFRQRLKLTSRHGAQYEYGSRQPDALVETQHIPVRLL